MALGPFMVKGILFKELGLRREHLVDISESEWAIVWSDKALKGLPWILQLEMVLWILQG